MLARVFLSFLLNKTDKVEADLNRESFKLGDDRGKSQDGDDSKGDTQW